MKMIEEIKGWKAKDWLGAAIIIGVVLVLGLIAVNQFIDYRFKAQLLIDPCNRCLEINPELELVQKNILSNFKGLNVSLPTN